MKFEYLKQVVVNADIDIEDIGNCAIKAFNDEGHEYILIVETKLGSSRIFQYGPVIPDMEELPKSTNCSFKRIQFSQSKLIKTIKDFLNNPYASITQVFEVTKEEALEDCVSFIEYMKKDLF